MPYELNPEWLNQSLPSSDFRPEDYPQGQSAPIVAPVVAQDLNPQTQSAPGTLSADGNPVMGTPGTITTQFQGEASPTTRYVPPGPETRQGPMPQWFTDYERQRSAFLDERRAQDEAWQMAQRMQANRQMEEAYTKAMQLEGQLGFAADVKAGVPIPQALGKWAPKMYWQNPSQSERALADVMRFDSRMAPPPDVSVKNIGGYDIAQAGNRIMQLRPPVGEGGGYEITSTPALDPGKQLEALQFRIKSIDDEIENIPYATNGTKEEQAANKKALEQEKRGLIERHKQILESSPSQRTTRRTNLPSSGAVKVGDVIDGYRYKGGPKNQKSSWEKAE